MLILILLASSLLTCLAQPDSAGTSFIFGYVRDAEQDISNQLLSVTVLNVNPIDCLFTIQYRENYDSKDPSIKNITVPATNMIEVPIPSWYGWAYESGGMQMNGPRQLITATCSCAVTLIANNYDNATYQGDSFLVLPTIWAQSGSVYAFTLPPASNEAGNLGYQHISIIPTERDVNGTLTVFGSEPLPFTAILNGPTTYFSAHTPKAQPLSYKIEADGPILILAGVTCAGNYIACDHAAFMPQPMPSTSCYANPTISDNHPTSTSTTNGFYADIPPCPTQTMTVTGNRDQISHDYILSNSKQTSLLTFDSSFGAAINMHIETAPIHVTRYHDLSIDQKQGAFIDTVASTSQFITGKSSFFTKNDNDIVEVLCTIPVCINMTVDEEKIFPTSNYTTVGRIDNTNYYSLVTPIPTKGFHIIHSNTEGPYAYYVVGRNGNAVYGYIGGINMPKLNFLTSTTSGPSTTAFTTPKSSTPTVNSSTPSSSPSSSSSTPSTAKTVNPVTSPSTTKPTPNSVTSPSTTSNPVTSPTTRTTPNSVTSPSSTPTSVTSPTAKPTPNPLTTPSTSPKPVTSPTTKPTANPVTTPSTARPIASSTTSPSVSATSASSSTSKSTVTIKPLTTPKATTPTSTSSTGKHSSTSPHPTAPSITVVTLTPGLTSYSSSVMTMSSTYVSESPESTVASSTPSNGLTTPPPQGTSAQSLPSSAPTIPTSPTLSTTTSKGNSLSSFCMFTLFITCLRFLL